MNEPSGRGTPRVLALRTTRNDMTEHTTSKLAEKKCLACHGSPPLLAEAQINSLLGQLSNWQVEGGKFLTRQYKSADFISALSLANKVGAIAEEEQHHPDLLVIWGMLGIKIWTHAAHSLTENDFILAAKIDRLMQAEQQD
jgi:4a-hydroxytetrahydrobiopterin dehydratase